MNVRRWRAKRYLILAATISVVSVRRRPEYDAAEAFQSYRSRSSRGEFRARDRPSLVVDDDDDDDERG